ncbi:hypothetical protein ABZ990_02420 [Streptomyces sp. NPDC046203]|uniref:hypothetical protein n=1 Tax=Streptomyces sp. NPDC046203 TaxID=3154602 RepID=UPI0033C359AF
MPLIDPAAAHPRRLLDALLLAAALRPHRLVRRARERHGTRGDGYGAVAARRDPAAEVAEAVEAAERAESGNVYAFLAHHASPAWLGPFGDRADCSPHFVAATAGQARGDRFPYGGRRPAGCSGRWCPSSPRAGR